MDFICWKNHNQLFLSKNLHISRIGVLMIYQMTGLYHAISLKNNRKTKFWLVLTYAILFGPWIKTSKYWSVFCDPIGIWSLGHILLIWLFISWYSSNASFSSPTCYYWHSYYLEVCLCLFCIVNSCSYWSDFNLHKIYVGEEFLPSLGHFQVGVATVLCHRWLRFKSWEQPLHL